MTTPTTTPASDETERHTEECSGWCDSGPLIGQMIDQFCDCVYGELRALQAENERLREENEEVHNESVKVLTVKFKTLQAERDKYKAAAEERWGMIEFVGQPSAQELLNVQPARIFYLRQTSGGGYE